MSGYLHFTREREASPAGRILGLLHEAGNAYHSTADWTGGDDDDPPYSERIEEMVCRECDALTAERDELKEEADWVRKKLNLSPDTHFIKGSGSLAGTLHLLCHRANGYTAYIESYKCDDLQGAIGRQTGEIETLPAERDELRATVSKLHVDLGQFREEGRLRLRSQAMHGIQLLPEHLQEGAFRDLKANEAAALAASEEK